MTLPNFQHANLPRPKLNSLDVTANLRHFAIITYKVPAEKVRPHVDPLFELDTFLDENNIPHVWVSMVPFQDQDFHFHFCPWLKFKFGQTNYRTYVINPQTNQRAVWFFGTTLDSSSVVIPRFLWKLPWHHGSVKFNCDYNQQLNKYNSYKITTNTGWAKADIELEDTGLPVDTLPHFSNLEAGLVILTHPLTGYFYRRDHQIGTYSIWHDKLHCNMGKIKHARIELFDKLNLVPYAEQHSPHSILIQHETEFIIRLPPKLMNSIK